jgi:hypothetical protein
MLIALLLVALLVPDYVDAACPAARSRSRSESGSVKGRVGGSGSVKGRVGGSAKQTPIRRPKMITVPKQGEYAVSCPSRPREGCEVAESSAILVRDDADDSKDLLVWRWRGTTKSTELDIGDPSETTAVGLCVYDSFEGHRFLQTALRVEPGGPWDRRRSGAWHYTSTGQSSSGVTRIGARTSKSGKTRFGLKARGKRIPLPLEPATRAKLYHKDRDVLVQLVTTANDRCWQSSFATAAENTTVSFAAPVSRDGSATSAATR